MLSDLGARLREWRHHLHQNPEVGFAETATSGYVADLLTSFGLSPQRGIGGTGVVASLSLGSGIGAVGLRADMDALPLLERAEHAYASRNGRMHACGHDGHMAMLLGAAAVLAAEGGFDGTVRFIFQPAEEHGRGAQAMIEDGLLERFGVDAIYGLHNLPGLPAGHVHTRPGPIMASEDTFEITVTGRGGHAARPQMVIDPLVVGAEIVLALQTIVSRSLDPASAAVVSCTEFVTDGIRNAIPGTVTIRGDARTFDPNVQGLVERRLREICAGICAAHGATCSVTYRHEFVPTVNDPVCVDAAATAATAVVGRDRVDPSCAPIMASEDFAIFAQRVPACFAFLGNGTEPGAGGEPLHSSGYDFNDDILTTGAAYYVELVRTVLPESD
jgi:amidohydrolase